MNTVNNIKAIHKSDRGKRSGDKWGMFISIIEHNTTLKIKNKNENLRLLGFIWKKVIPIGKNVARKNMLIKIVIC